jgi:hypothetical protein
MGTGRVGAGLAPVPGFRIGQTSDHMVEGSTLIGSLAFFLFSKYYRQYFGQDLGCLIGNDAIVTKCFVIRAGFLQTLPVG